MIPRQLYKEETMMKRRDNMQNKEYFEAVLMINKEYIDALNAGESAQVQESLLKQCKTTLRTQVLERGLANEYEAYCRHKIATEGKLF